MGVLVQVRDVPDDVHRVLKSRAAASGLSLSEYTRQMLAAHAARPTVAELAARIAAREPPPPTSEAAEAAVRAIRDESG